MLGNGGAASLIDEYNMIPSGSTVICAVSGGADSVCLLHILDSLRPVYSFSLVAAHYNHHLRGEESDRDEAFVRDLCEAWKIPCRIGGCDVAAEAKARKQGIEETARNMRYAFLRENAEELGGALIATAHNADDNAETILFNLIRGTGLRGLTGIAPMRDGLIRPLLKCSRQDIEEYLHVHNLSHVEDSSNADETYSRNRIRHQVLPALQELNPKAVEHINQLADVCAVANHGLEAEAKQFVSQAQIKNDRLVFPMDSFYSAPTYVRSKILYFLLEKMGVGTKDLTQRHYNALCGLLYETDVHSDSRIDLPHGITARRSRHNQDWLILELRPPRLDYVQLLPDIPFLWGSYTLTLLDHPQGEGLALRPRLPAEWPKLHVGPCPPAQRLHLPGTNGPRTIKRLCLDKGIGLAERDTLPAFYVGDRLAAVWPLGVDVEFQPTQKECRFIQIKYTEEKENE